MSGEPFVSIVIAAYNSTATIGPCLDALLALDYPDCEIIVVDNASTDDTRAIAARYAAEHAATRRILVLDETRRGWPAARNRAWHYSKAPLVANIDADCFADPAWLRKLVAAVLADPTAGAAVGRTKVQLGATLAQQFYAAIDPFNIEKYVYGKATAHGRPCPWGGGNNVFRRELIEAFGGYDAIKYTSGADREFHRTFERETDYRTIYAPDALIWHEPRGSLREFFHNSVKYTADAVLQSPDDPAVAAYIKGYGRKNVGFLIRNTLGFFYRGARFLIGRETPQRLAQPIFWNAQALGAIWGVLKGRRRLARKSQAANHK